MANSREENVIFVDATGDISGLTNPSFIYGILISPSATTGGLVVIKKDSSTGQTIIRIKLLDDQSRYVPFNLPIRVQGTINITTLTTITSLNLYGIFD